MEKGYVKSRNPLNSLVGCERLERSTYGLRVRSSTNWANNPVRKKLYQQNRVRLIPALLFLSHDAFSRHVSGNYSGIVQRSVWIFYLTGQTEVLSVRTHVQENFFWPLLRFWQRGQDSRAVSWRVFRRNNAHNNESLLFFLLARFGCACIETGLSTW